MKWLFFVLPAGVQTLLVLRLVSTGLARRYPGFTSWMALLAISTLVLLAFSSQVTTAYRNTWIASQAMSMALLFVALVELTNRILEHYPGLRRISASGLFGLLLASAVVASAGESFNKPLRFFFSMQSAWNAAIAVYVILLVAFATYLDPLRRKNVIIHERVFAASCVMTAAIELFALFNYSRNQAITWLVACSGVILPLLWMRMSPAGEVDRRPAVPAGQAHGSIAETQATLDRLEKMVTRSND